MTVRIMGGAYYNEFDPYAAAWLRNLISAGLIPGGDVDERDIKEVQPDDLKGYTQCHFFAGIGGWPHALDIAGWGDRPVWTGSCPCQPLSSAGQRKGHVDERHLWPAFHDLIAECRPAMVFGEQVASKDGREWFAAVRADLERMGYACGGADMPAAGVGAPHIRQRLWWVADADEGQRGRRAGGERRQRDGAPPGREQGNGQPERRCEDGGVAVATGEHGRPGTGRNDGPEAIDGGAVGNTDQPGPQGWRERSDEYADQQSPWAASEFIPCDDGKARPTQPGLFPLADGLPAGMDGCGPVSRVGVIRGAGNSIVPKGAAEFVAAYMDCGGDVK